MSFVFSNIVDCVSMGARIHVFHTLHFTYHKLAMIMLKLKCTTALQCILQLSTDFHSLTGSLVNSLDRVNKNILLKQISSTFEVIHQRVELLIRRVFPLQSRPSMSFSMNDE